MRGLMGLQIEEYDILAPSHLSAVPNVDKILRLSCT